MYISFCLLPASLDELRILIVICWIRVLILLHILKSPSLLRLYHLHSHQKWFPISPVTTFKWQTPNSYRQGMVTNKLKIRGCRYQIEDSNSIFPHSFNKYLLSTYKPVERHSPVLPELYETGIREDKGLQYLVVGAEGDALDTRGAWGSGD